MSHNDLKIYVPDIYLGGKGSNILIDVGNYLFDNLDGETLKLINNQYVMTADETGLAQYEDLFGIQANPNIESIDFRRERIINRLSNKDPYTYELLIMKLDSLVGKNNYTISLTGTNKLTITFLAVPQEKTTEARVTLASILPANIWVTYNNTIYTINYGTLYYGTTTATAIGYHIT